MTPRPIKGFEDRYFIYPDGRVWSNFGGGRFLRPALTLAGYKFVALFKRQRQTLKTLHALVAEHYIRPRRAGEVVNHKDGNKLNNHVTNLEVVTKSEDCKHAIRTGLRVQKRGEDHCRAKLTESEVREIRVIDAFGLRRTVIGRAYGVSHHTIYAICTGKYWKHVKED